MVVSALVPLVTVVSYDPTPLRVVVTALCRGMAGFLTDRR